MIDEALKPAPADSNKPDGRWPRQVKYILGNEGAERFSYYGMKGILAVYITTVLMLSKDNASTIIHLFGFVNYFMPVLGAWVSDRFWGRYRTILWVSLFYCLGHGVLACSDLIDTINGKTALLYVGLGLIAFGAGGIKPCVSAFMGDQFGPRQRHLLEKAYAAFYWMINFGSTLAFLIIPWIRDAHGYGWAFGVPGLAMGVATIIFWLGTPGYVHVAPSGDPAWRQKLVWIVAILASITALVWLNVSHPVYFATALYGVLAAFVVAAIIWIVSFVEYVRRATTPLALSAFSVWLYAFVQRMSGKSRSLWDGLEAKFTPVAIDHGVSFGRIMSIFLMIPVFWALFDQTFSTWVLQGEQMVPLYIGSYKIGAEQMLSANPILVLILVPFTTLVLYPAMGRLATPLRRMSFGMFLTAISYIIVAWLQQRLESGEAVSIAWQIAPYIVLTTAEVLISTTGLEFAFTQAAAAMKSTITGYWQLTVAVGNLLVVFITTALGGHDSAASVTSGRFMMYAGLTFVSAIAFSLIAARYRYREVPPVIAGS